MGIYHHHWVLSIKDKGIWLINLAGGSYSIGIPGSFNYWGLSELKNWEPPLINHCSSQDTESPGMGWRRAYLVGGLVDYSKVPSGNRGWTLRGNFEGHCRNQPCIYIYVYWREGIACTANICVQSIKPAAWEVLSRRFFPVDLMLGFGIPNSWKHPQKLLMFLFVDWTWTPCCLCQPFATGNWDVGLPLFASAPIWLEKTGPSKTGLRDWPE